MIVVIKSDLTGAALPCWTRLAFFRDLGPNAPVSFSPHPISLISVRSHRTIPVPPKVTTSLDMERRPRIWPPKASSNAVISYDDNSGRKTENLLGLKNNQRPPVPLSGKRPLQE